MVTLEAAWADQTSTTKADDERGRNPKKGCHRHQLGDPLGKGLISGWMRVLIILYSIWSAFDTGYEHVLISGKENNS